MLDVETWSKTVEVATLAGRVHTQVHVAGSGRPVVFLHGLTGVDWNPLVARLARDHEVYAPEFPGTGRSEGLEELQTMWDVVLHLDELFAALDLKRPDLIGHSVGGMFAAEFAAAYPASVGKLILISAAGIWLDDAPSADPFGTAPAAMAELIAHDPASELAQSWRQQPVDADEALARWQALAAASRFLWPLPDRGLRRRAHRITAPTLILWGESDGLYPTSYGEALQRLIRGSELEILPDAAHYPHVEQPDIASAILAEFLRSVA